MNEQLDPFNVGRFASGARAYFVTGTGHRFPWSELTPLERSVRILRGQAPKEWASNGYARGSHDAAA